VVGEPTQFAVLPDAMRRAIFASREWSAGTLEGPHGPLIILNPVHADTRLRVTIAEELSHLVMGHPPSKIDPATGTLTYNATMEQEAFSVGGALVMLYDQLFRLTKSGRPLNEIAAAFGVSTSMARCRINRTGLSRMHRKRAASA
jgi:Zn-dependent peptidase ImmA (M78 family)